MTLHLKCHLTSRDAFKIQIIDPFSQNNPLLVEFVRKNDVTLGKRLNVIF